MTTDQHTIGFNEPATKTIGLCMIVKDEAAVIERCLDSVRPLIDYALIEDTGSTDGTQEIVRAYLRRHGIAGEVIEEPWRDFAYNRTHVMARLRDRVSIDYALIMDADDRLVIDDGFDVTAFKAGLRADVYHVWIRLGSTRYGRPQICSNRLDFHFRGVVHEFLQSPPRSSSETVKGFHIAAGVEGGRSKDPDKYRKDALRLEQALAAETDAFMRARYTFYMAQSWRDCGENAKAVAAYLDRAALGGWKEEVYVSLYNAGKLQQVLGEPIETVLATLQRAIDLIPQRNEARQVATRACRFAKRHELGYEIARGGLDLPEPATGLFIESWIYQYGLLDEFAINAYWAGHQAESLAACERLLRSDALPARERPRILQNAEFAYQRMAPRVPKPEIRTQGEGRTALARHLRDAFDRAMAREGTFDPMLPGFEARPESASPMSSGRKYRMLVNRLIAEIDDARYIEIGSFTGSTLCTAISGNTVSAIAIDNWSLFGGPVQLFLRNLARFRGPGAKVSVIENDFRAVDYAHLPKSNVYLFDGPHSRKDHFDAIDLVLPALDETFVVMVDDWDWSQVREGTWQAIRENGLTVDLAIEVLTTTDGTTPSFGGQQSDWHNGYLFAVLAGNKRTGVAAKTVVETAPLPVPVPLAPRETPRVLLAVLAKQNEPALPFYLMCIEALDYPKASMVLYVHAENGAEQARKTLTEWIKRVGPQYARVEFDTRDATKPALRQESLLFTLKAGCDFYFVADTDNVLRPQVLRELVAANQPVVGPLLHHVDAGAPHANFSTSVDTDGNPGASEEDAWLAQRRVKGLCQVDLISGTYLVRADMIQRLSYADGSNRPPSVVFADSARRGDAPQYLDTREIYGYVVPDKGAEPVIRRLGPTVGLRLLQQRQQGNAWQIAFCCGLPGSGSTWMFNLVREITIAAGWPFLSQYAGSETDFLPTLFHDTRMIVKTHATPPGIQAFISASQQPVTLTVRDPRDSVVSLMHRFGENFDSALNYIAGDAEHFVALAKRGSVQVWRYEDGFITDEGTFEKVAALLGANIPAEKRASILRKLSADEVRKTIDKLAAADQMQSDRDLATRWHRNHLGDGKIGKFAEILTPAQQKAVEERTREFRVLFGYEPAAAAPATVGQAGRAGGEVRPRIREVAPRSINILRPGAIGDVLASSAVTSQLAARHPNLPVRYYTKCPEMARLLVGVGEVLDADKWDTREPGRDLCLIGYPLAEGYPERPMQKHLVAYFCDEAGVPFGKPQLKEPEPFAIDRPAWVTLHPNTGWSVYKEWSYDNWAAIVARVHEVYPNIAVAQIGGSGAALVDGVDCDLRGRTSISQAVWLVKNSVLHLGVDSFSNHAAGAFEHPAVIVFGSTNPTGFGYATAINLWAGLGCSPCYREDPAITRHDRGPCVNPPGQVYNEPRHACMAAITVDQVWQAITDLVPAVERRRAGRR